MKESFEDRINTIKNDLKRAWNEVHGCLVNTHPNCHRKSFGMCCCTCGNHYEDFYHCTTSPKPEGAEGCVCSTHKGWICLISFEGERPKAHSNWSEHGICEMWSDKK